MFSVIKSIIWLVLFLVAAYFVLNFFGYAVNQDYFSETKNQCEEKIKECANNTIHKGVDNVECNFNCVDPKLIIKKK